MAERLSAFDLAHEDPRVVARYDTARFAKRGRWNKVNAALRRTLEEITLAELIRPESFVHSPLPASAAGAGRSLAH